MTRLPAALVLLAGAAHAAERPPITPQRDVDVTYHIVLPAADGPPLQQRMRWSVAAGKLRVDPPTPGLYLIVDYRTKQMVVVKLAERAVLDMSGAGPGLVGSAAGEYRRKDDAQVAGLPCTNWLTTDAAGRETTLCLTADGVMLRAAHGATALLEATSVQYGPQDPAAFVPPDGFTHVAGDQR